MKHIITVLFVVWSCISVFAQPKVIAHRGYWDTENSAQNSITALYKAAEIGCYGSEFDVHMTDDGQLVVYHDNSLNGMLIKGTSYAALRDYQLANGEILPTLEQYLIHAKNCPDIKLILELKTGKPDAKFVQEFVSKTLELVDKYQLQDRTEYIAFSLDICKEMRKQRPAVDVYYLNGDLTPAQLKKLNLTGLDYHYNVLTKKKNYVNDAHKKGLLVNVWTANKEATIREMIAMGVDFITTDKPELVQALIKELAGK